jgi:mono/diheme cytochrome c family protein
MNVISFKKPTNLFLGLFSFLLAFGVSTTPLQAQEDGEKLFKSYCASCHSAGANMLVGPGLAGVYDKYEREWLYKWIKNSSALIATGDAQAVAVYEQYNKVMMPAQPVTDVQIDAILDYIKVYNEAAPVVADAGAGADTEVVVAEDEGLSGYAIAGIVVLFLILIILLRKVQYIFVAAKARDAGDEMPEETTMAQAVGLTISQNKTIFALMGIVCLALFAKGGWDSAFSVGVFQGYEPEQPIKFSHKLHAGTNGIDCNYCHTSASYSKSAGIPSPNLCMNCHTYIQEGPQYGKEEIGKIYAALDFDPVTKTYGPNQKPIKWVKVHNLPDHVYFNHSQHVAIGKIACEKCHGPVETYTVGKQHSELTMGWCINCHRETKVQMADNGYYDEIHERLPDELKKQYLEDGTITVSELGGIECSKCHY